MSDLDANLAWTDGFETGVTAGAMHERDHIAGTLVDTCILLVCTFAGYMVAKGLTEFATERWNAKPVNTNDSDAAGE